MEELPLIAEIPLPTEAETLKLGSSLAVSARPGDILALRGPLGAGKTTLARGFIARRTGTDEEVVSPTFTLVQIYDAGAAPIWHFDLYRIAKAADVLELGWDDAMSGGISLVEWPERLGPLLPRTRLDVALSLDGAARRAELRGGAEWKERIGAAGHV